MRGRGDLEWEGHLSCCQPACHDRRCKPAVFVGLGSDLRLSRYDFDETELQEEADPDI